MIDMLLESIRYSLGDKESDCTCIFCTTKNHLDKYLEMVAKKKSSSDLNLTEGCTVRLENGEEHAIQKNLTGKYAANYIWRAKDSAWTWNSNGIYDEATTATDHLNIKEVIARPEDITADHDLISRFINEKSKSKESLLFSDYVALNALNSGISTANDPEKACIKIALERFKKSVFTGSLILDDPGYEDKPTLHLYEGARVKLRSGAEQTITKNRNSSAWPWRIKNTDTSSATFTANGKYNSSTYEHNHDIVEVLPPRVGDWIDTEKSKEKMKIVNIITPCQIYVCQTEDDIKDDAETHRLLHTGLHKITKLYHDDPKPTYDLKPGMVVEVSTGAQFRISHKKTDNPIYKEGFTPWVTTCVKDNEPYHSIDWRYVMMWDKYGNFHNIKPYNITRIVSEPEELKLEVDSFWKAENGKKIFINYFSPIAGDGYRFTGSVVGENNYIWFNKDGIAYGETNKKYDIVSKWEE